MRRRVVALLLVCMVVGAVTACGSSGAEQAKEVEEAAVQEETEAEKEEPKEAAGEEQETKEETKDALTQFEDALNEKGIEYEKVTMAAEYVGAEQGIKFKIGDGAVELYRYDTESEAYKEAEETQSIDLEGFGAFQATVKNGLAMTVSNLDEADYIEIFDKIAR